MRSRARASRSSSRGSPWFVNEQEERQQASGTGRGCGPDNGDGAERAAADRAADRRRSVSVRVCGAGGAAERGEVDDPQPAARHEGGGDDAQAARSEEHTSELQSQSNLVCRLLLEKKKQKNKNN